MYEFPFQLKCMDVACKKTLAMVCLTYHRYYNLGVKKCYLLFIWSSKHCDIRKVILTDFVVITAVPW